MSVRSQHIVSGQAEEARRHIPSPHMFSTGGVIGATIAILRIVAWLLLIASTFGNYVQFAGGWEHLHWAWSDMIGSVAWAAVLFALLYQGIFSLLQWGAKAQRWWLLYIVALLASAIPSFLTYNAWAGDYLSAQVGSVLSLLIIGIGVIGADALPEWILVK